MPERVELDRLIRAPFTTEHESAVEALLADLADVIPVVGEIAGLVRIVEALEKKDYTRLALELGDLVAGVPPALGEVGDIVTPTNVLLYFARKKT